MYNHQFSQDWNDLEVAYAPRIEPDVLGTFQGCSMPIPDNSGLHPMLDIPGFML